MTSTCQQTKVYQPSDLGDFDYQQDLGNPGEYPFTRGIYPEMYGKRPWTFRQYSGFGTAAQSNERYRYLLQRGQTGLSIAFDLPTQLGYDSDHPVTLGEVGKVGVAIDTLKDMEILFDQIDLSKVSTSMTINAPAAILLAMYIAVGEQQGVSSEKLTGTIQNDVLKEYIARGTYIFPPRPSLRIVTDIFQYCFEKVPKWNTISISGYHIREAGSTAVQEVAFTLANAVTYVEAATQKGLHIDKFAPRLSFFFNSHHNFLEEIAKFRAARRLWAKIMKEKFKAKDPKSMMLRFHTQTAGSTLTAQQIENNVVRVTLQALAAALGGTQSLHTNSFDEALALPCEESVRVALRTQQIIAHESGITATPDPLAGSYYLETLTDKIEKEAVDYLKTIEEKGGVINCIESGYLEKEIMESAYRYQQKLETKEFILVGVNEFQEKETKKLNLLKVDPAIREDQIEQLEEVKKKRSASKVENSLKSLKEAARSDENLMPFILEAVRNYVSLGECCQVMRDVFGVYQKTPVI